MNRFVHLSDPNIEKDGNFFVLHKSDIQHVPLNTSSFIKACNKIITMLKKRVLYLKTQVKAIKTINNKRAKVISESLKRPIYCRVMSQEIIRHTTSHKTTIGEFHTNISC